LANNVAYALAVEKLLGNRKESAAALPVHPRDVLASWRAFRRTCWGWARLDWTSARSRFFCSRSRSAKKFTISANRSPARGSRPATRALRRVARHPAWLVRRRPQVPQ